MEQFLQFAGSNHAELEKILQHYSQNPADSLKYRAALFLIENMPGHYSYKNQEVINQYYDGIDSITESYKNSEDYGAINAAYEKESAGYVNLLEFVEDIQIITSGFLIDNIDSSFEVWQNGEWAKHVNFDDFCEYILPYKSTECQTLDNWREYLLKQYNGNMDVLQYCGQTSGSAYWACYNINRELNGQLGYKIYPVSGKIPVK
ncbi:hypothetical protein FACS189463_0560 [Bacteroidia bacterium]|nr:hypothetical protein FACS189463_0560 [Bacteroidia bacterium]